MSTIKIEFPADRPDVAKVLGEALIAVSSLVSVTAIPGTLEDTADTAGRSDGLVGSLDDAGSDANGMFNKSELDEQNNLVDPANTDTKGVPFNAEFCGKAAKPYYASGKRAGQWKKRQGVDELAYDNWYAEQLANVAPSSAGQDNQQTSVNTANAFNNQQQDAGANNEPAAPHDAGTLMAWVSEMQAAGRITQQQVNEAYQQAGVTMTDVFPGPNKTDDTIAQAVRNVHTILMSWV